MTARYLADVSNTTVRYLADVSHMTVRYLAGMSGMPVRYLAVLLMSRGSFPLSPGIPKVTIIHYHHLSASIIIIIIIIYHSPSGIVLNSGLRSKILRTSSRPVSRCRHCPTCAIAWVVRVVAINSYELMIHIR